MRFISYIFFFLFLAACSTNSKTNLAGKWKINSMEINGVSFDSTLLYGSFIEFTKSGNYTSNIFGNSESGNFKIAKDSLWFYCKSDTQIADKFYLFSAKDSTRLTLTSTTNKNKMTTDLIKI